MRKVVFWRSEWVGGSPLPDPSPVKVTGAIELTTTIRVYTAPPGSPEGGPSAAGSQPSSPRRFEGLLTTTGAVITKPTMLGEECSAHPATVEPMPPSPGHAPARRWSVAIAGRLKSIEHHNQKMLRMDARDTELSRKVDELRRLEVENDGL
ncbi:hypothetical protein GUJ93_ZPchr0013g36809 [Zizania palustris]|uniref:Uncharacterized protein n=1 Tax=Zizania palustris TaxID=103762 RepID=A0A8J5X541_ZIZPA|nr:hypothetical protein GUJ93_ZPchr0013g36809 [Zizania palustris]